LQLWKRARRLSASRLRASMADGPAPRGTSFSQGVNASSSTSGSSGSGLF
jgi:hypothetical protein